MDILANKDDIYLFFYETSFCYGWRSGQNLVLSILLQDMQEGFLAAGGSR